MMETAGEERVRAARNLCQLEEAALLLEEAATARDASKISPGFPARLSAVLNGLTAVSSRDDAERLLSAGVSMWNAVIAFEGCEVDQGISEALIKIRHVAVDCMYMSTTVLGGISARFNIDELSLLKFYTACGRRYAADLNDMEMADVCFTRAAEFVAEALNLAAEEQGDQHFGFSQAMFDLLLGRAECAWEKGNCDQAELFVNEARRYVVNLPGRLEFLASVEYNFGLYMYQKKETERSLKWLKKSMETRESEANVSRNSQKHAKTARLAGVCLLALQDYEASWEMMKSAEDIHHDPVGSYLLLKLSIIAKKSDAMDILTKTIEDPDVTLDVCMACVSLFGDAQRISEAAVGFERLFIRFTDDLLAITSTIGLRYFQTLAALGKIDKSLEVFDSCCDALTKLKSSLLDSGGDNASANSIRESIPLAKWSALLLATGSSQADRKDFHSASRLLNRCLIFTKTYCADWNSDRDDPSSTGNVVLENEAAVSRLASSCALCAIDSMSRKVNVTPASCAEVEEVEQRTSEVERELLSMALGHAERAKVLDPTDFAPRLLLFRAYIICKEYQKAASELRQASLEIKSFDPGALAEAACAARDVGSKPAVIAALRCILRMDPETLSKNLIATSPSPPKGFYGKILLSCVHILLESGRKEGSDLEQVGDDSGISDNHGRNDEADEDLLDILRFGLKGIERLGLDFAFNEEKEDIRECVNYLVNVSWNKGRAAGIGKDFARFWGFFDVCFQMCGMLPKSTEGLQTQRMSKVMCASAVIENPNSKGEEFKKARVDVVEARRLTEELRDISPCGRGDPIEGLLSILEARCCVGSSDIRSLVTVVESVLGREEIAVGVLEQLAAVCHNYNDQDEESRSACRAQCADLTAALLSKAVDVRLRDSCKDLPAIAITMREHLGVEMSRGCTGGRVYKIFMKAVSVVLEYRDDFPTDEWRWLVAVGWDRAEMCRHVGQKDDARRWYQAALELASGCVALASYIPRIELLLGTL